MNTIEYHSVKYRPSQFWPLVRVLQKDGWEVAISASRRKDDYPYTMGAWMADSRGVKIIDGMYAKSPFLALGNLVAEIQKAGAK